MSENKTTSELELGITGFRAHKKNGVWQSIWLELCDQWEGSERIECHVSRVSPGSTFQRSLAKALSMRGCSHAQTTKR